MQLKSELGSLGNHLGQLTLHYQPILSARTGRMTGVEALMRWQHPTRGLALPDLVHRIRRRDRSDRLVGAAAMDMACAQAAAWRDLGIACPTISVNLSARQLHDPGVVDMVARSLAKYGLPPADLIIEITESITMKGADQAVERLRRLKDLGVSIAIDDFGTGWSSLSYLRRPPGRLRQVRPLVHCGCRDRSGRRHAHLADEQPRTCTRPRDCRRGNRDRRSTPCRAAARM